MTDDSFDAPTISERVAALRTGRAHAVALIDEARERAQRDAALNAIAWADWEAARAEAAERDREAAAGRLRGPLHGMPVSIKDLYQMRGTTMRAGTQAPLPAFDRDEAVAVGRLRDAGAILFAKTNLVEVALGATGENPWTGDVRNPWDPALQSGGSSSGAGVCVARGIGVAGLGSDTGGSIRVPANFCGVVGFKPTFGAVPLAGALHLSWTLDHGGPLTRSVADARTVFEVLAQRRTDHGAVARAPRLAVPAAWLASRLSPQVRDVFERCVARLRAAGATVVDVETDALDRAWQCYPFISRSEAAYVHRAALAAGGHGFSEQVLALLRDGETISAGRYFDAMRERDEVRRLLSAITRDHDALILPTAPVLPPLRGQTEVDTIGGKMPTRQAVLGQTLPFNLSGQPALTIPMGFSAGLPTGLMLVGAPDADARLLALGAWCEPLMNEPA